MRVALVHDWLTGMRGGERCLEVFCELFPGATIFTLLHVPGTVSQGIDRLPIRSSPLEAVPGIRRFYRLGLPVFPWLIERFDLRGYDLVLSSSHCVAKGVRVAPGALHIAYIYTPMRYVWDLYDDYFAPGRAGWLQRAAMVALRPRLQRWDVASAGRIDHLVAISRHVADRIKRHYGREASVIYPPVEVARFQVGQGAGEFYLVVSAFAPYKRLDLAIQACNLLRRPLKIVGEGQDERRLRAMAGPTVEFLGPRSDPEVAELYTRCRALLFPGVEDFGITPLEAMASGRPVVAYGRGGVLETVIPLNPLSGDRPAPQPRGAGDAAGSAQPTGIFFHEQTAEALAEAIRVLEANHDRFVPETLRRHAMAFDRQVFKDKIATFVAERWTAHGKATGSVSAQEA
jgi:glycosyltransferase involved in cell wall biosynthesis